ncbi:hypothetical protein F5882DRAFT_466726 [Hyaloscypha sp. PMI_1271]|nr:hypothetical protein F5882DRAFT_466726 [Hyaloscypha sp. PMI_1271]
MAPKQVQNTSLKRSSRNVATKPAGFYAPATRVEKKAASAKATKATAVKKAAAVKVPAAKGPVAKAPAAKAPASKAQPKKVPAASSTSSSTSTSSDSPAKAPSADGKTQAKKGAVVIKSPSLAKEVLASVRLSPWKPSPSHPKYDGYNKDEEVSTGFGIPSWRRRGSMTKVGTLSVPCNSSGGSSERSFSYRS